MKLLQTRKNGNNIFFIIDHFPNVKGQVVYNPVLDNFHTEENNVSGYAVLYANQSPKEWKDKGVKHIGIQELRMKLFQSKKSIEAIPMEKFLKDFSTFSKYTTAHAYLFSEGLNWIEVEYNGKKFVK
jgi:hypothetical protein